MSPVRWIRTLYRNLFLSSRVEKDLDDEVRGYIAMSAHERERSGAGDREALRDIVREIGGPDQIKEQVRDSRRGHMLETLIKDARYGLRTLAKSPGFTSIAVFSLALGIGGNTVMFSIVNSALLRPLSYREPDRLVRITEYYPKGGAAALQAESKSMEISSYTLDSEFNLTGEGAPVHLIGSGVFANFFSLLGVEAQVGRTFHAGENHPGQDGVVILSYGLWREKFGADPNVVGRPLNLDGTMRTIVGIMPASFRFPSSQVRLWIPVRLDPSDQLSYWNAGWVPLIARLRAGSTLAQARDEITALNLDILKLFPYTMPQDWHKNATVMPLQQDLVSDIRAKLLLLLAAVALVLMIACANVASLLLAKAASRQKELAIKAALGAGRGRILRQLLTEAVMLSAAGAGAGLILSLGLLEGAKALLPIDTPGLAEIGIDWRALAFASVLSVVTGLIFGIAPALSASRINLAESIKTRGQRASGTGTTRLRSALIVTEVALAAVLVVGATLLSRSLWLLTQADPGFKPNNVFSARMYPDRVRYQGTVGSDLTDEAPSRCLALYREILNRAKGITGASRVAIANTIPLDSDIPAIPVELEDHPIVPAQTIAPMFWAGAVTPDYFKTLGISTLSGRSFTDTDGEKSERVVMVSAATAREYWPDQNPIGKHLRALWDDKWRVVIGVVADVRQFDLSNKTPDWIRGVVYMPYPQAVGVDRKLPLYMDLIVRSSENPGVVSGQIRQLVAGVNPDVPVSDVQQLQTIVLDSTSQSRSLVWLFSGFACSALLLAAIGVYGLVSYSTAQRTGELGLRLALGATKTNLFGLVIRHSLTLVTAGLALGIVASLVLTRALSAFLYGVAPTDPVTLVGACAILMGVGLLAGYVPARRAANVDPLRALAVE